MTTLLERVHVVLLRPRWAANLGAVARAMKNFGLKRLTLVDSRIGAWTDAHRMAVKAEDVLAGAQQLERLDDALADARWLVATTDDPPPGLRVLTPQQLADEALERGAPTLLFGGEQNGLFPAELLRCHAAAVIPVDRGQTSLNLAQAVCVFGAALFARHGVPATPAPPVARAPVAMLQHLERLLGELLAQSAFGDADRGKHAVAELVQPLYRAGLTEPEVRAWLVALHKAAQAPRRPVPPR